MILNWIKGIFVQRPGRLLGSIVGVAVTITLLACLGMFLTTSTRTMTSRAVAEVAIDWQVQLSAKANDPAIQKALAGTPRLRVMKKVEYARVAGFHSVTGGTEQTTGAGRVVGLSSGYRAALPRVIRQLTGSPSGVELAQQTAANLHAVPGDTVTIERIGAPPVAVKVDGVIALHNPDSFFYPIGVPPSAAPQAPPDNVLYIPEGMWNKLFGAASAKADAQTVTQYHVMLDHGSLPTQPIGAYTYVTGLANNLEARTSGAVTVGDNLAAHLSAVRADALYARVLFLFLGLPGTLLSILITLSIALSGRKHLLQEQALLRLRGASMRQVLGYETAEAMIVGLGGTVLGIALTFLVARFSIGVVSVFGGSNLEWMLSSAVAGFLVVTAAVIFLAWRLASRTTVSASRAVVRAGGPGIWRRVFLDVLLLCVAVFLYWRTAQSGYQVVMAPEGVPSVSVHYDAFVAPLFLWIGGVLFSIRVLESAIGRGKNGLSSLLRPVARNLSGVVSRSIGRQRGLISRGVVLVALAVAFSVSTAVFNTTYNAQSRVDAQLTNGADVSVAGQTASPPSSYLAKIKSIPGVLAAEPMMHRFAYVGNDLQDMYGIHPLTFGRATKMSNAYFAGGNAQASLSLLEHNRNGVLVSEETQKTYQLHVGDTINLRLQLARDHQYHTVPFTFVGVVREFPTAPKDSFLVANADYLAAATGSSGEEVVLIRTDGPVRAVAAHVAAVVSSMPGAKTSDIQTVQKSIASNLTAIDLRGLTGLELVFAIIFVMGATGLILGLGMNERRRNFSILEAIGATSRQLGAFIWSEGLLILSGGVVIGTALGFVVSQVLVKVLKGVFDPPPEHLVVPWGYLALLLLAAVAATVGAVAAMKGLSRRPVVEELRRQ